MKYSKLLFIDIFFVIGIILGYYAFFYNILIILVILFFFTILFFFLKSKNNIKNNAKIGIFYIIILLLGLISIKLEISNFSSIKIKDKKILFLSKGIIVYPPLPMDLFFSKISNNIKVRDIKRICYKNWFILKTTEIYTGKKWIKKEIYIKVIVLDENYRLFRGDLIQVIGWLSYIPPPTNPNEKSSYSYWKFRKIYYKLKVISSSNIKIIKSYQSNFILDIFFRIKLKYIRFLKEKLGYKEGNFISALLFDAKRLLNNELIEKFRDLGIYHLLVISGLHISLIGYIIYYIFLLFKVEYRLRAFFTIIILLYYILLTDLNPPVVRAGILAILYLFSIIIGRKSNIENLLYFIIFISLIYNPLQIFQLNFQLSILASLFIIHLGIKLLKKDKEGENPSLLKPNYIKKILKAINIYINNNFKISFCVWLGLSPLLIYKFSYISLIGIIGTIIFLPFVFIIICLSFITCFSILGSFWITQSILLIFIKLVLKILFFLINLLIPIKICPFPPKFYYILLFYMVIFYILIFLKKRPFFKILLISILALVLYMVPYLEIYLNKSDFYKNKVSVLNVGNGNCILIEIGNKKFLYDCGSIDKTMSRKVILPFLLYKRIKQIDGIIISHNDIDHYNGIFKILEYITIKKIYITSRFYNQCFKLIKFIKDNYNLKFFIIKTPIKIEKIDLNGNKIIFIYPGYYLAPKQSDNNHSLLLLIKYKNNKKIFLTADLEAKGIKILIDKFLNTNKELKRMFKDIYLFQIPHHGSKIKNIENFLKNVKIKIGFISGDRYLYNKEYLQLYKKFKIKIYTTFQNGILIFKCF